MCAGAYLLFLEPGGDDPKSSLGEMALNMAIQVFQGRPTLIHVELLLLDEGGAGAKHFASYIGDRAAWRGNKTENRSYYLESCCGRWRAIPLKYAKVDEGFRDFGDHLELACDDVAGAPYSICRYITSAKPMRAFANYLPSDSTSPGHCATVTARVLKRAGFKKMCPHADAWYGPTSLFHDATTHLATSAMTMKASGGSIGTNCADATAIDALTRGALSCDTVRHLGVSRCRRACQIQEDRVMRELVFGDDTSQRLSQKGLASILLRQSLLL